MSDSLRESRPSWRRHGGRREVAVVMLHLSAVRKEGKGKGKGGRRRERALPGPPQLVGHGSLCGTFLVEPEYIYTC